MTQSSVFLGALATHKLVGRTAELQALAQAIQPPAPHQFQCLVLEARGGMGKTRLLREAYDRLTSPDPTNPAITANPDRGTWISAEAPTIALELIDLADVALHPLTGFLREARQRFERAIQNPAAAFARFDAAWLRYEEARDGELGFDEVARRGKDLQTAFEQDYAEIARDRRVVWILDTLEQLFAVPPEIAEYLDAIGVQSEDLGLTTYSWILAFIKASPPDTTLLLAGRPEPSRWLADVRAVLPAHAPSPLRVAEFTEHETDLYLASLCEQLAHIPNLDQRARDLRQATDDPHEIANLHRLTSGNPILLALYIDLFFNADVLPEPFSDPSSTEGLSDVDLQGVRDQLDTDLLDYLTQHLTDPEPQVLGYLSVMRRGLDRERLRMLWGTEDDLVIDRVFESLQRFSFIKVRGNTLFLHDEFYSIYQRNLSRQEPASQAAERARQQNIFQRLIDFSQDRTLALVRQIARIQAKLADLEASDQDYLPRKEEFRTLRGERRRVRIERVHYALYNDPKTGLNNQFFRVAGQAFLTNEPDIEELLQSEVMTFFFGGGQELNRRQTGASPEDWQLLRFHVLHERVARWVRRLILKGQRDQAQELARRATASHRELVSRYYPDLASLYAHPDGQLLSRLFLEEWAACRCFAAIYASKDLRTPLDELAQITERLKDALRETTLRTRLKEFRWRLQNILAECLLFQGFASASLYEFKVAEDFYRQANRILDRTEFKTLQSDVQNGLSRVLGERGDLFEALALCEEGLKVRDEYGFDYLRGLSRNTLALINTRNARPTRALEHATTALTIFRQLDNPRGIGLALIQVAEAQRRMWNLRAEEVVNDQVARSRITTDLLEEIRPLLAEAEELFSTRLPSEARLVEIWIEQGSLYRDWANFFGPSEAQYAFMQAEQYYQKAMTLAAQDNYRYPQHYLSACVNLAWLYARGGQRDRALMMVTRAEDFVAPVYKFSTAGPVDVNAVNVTNFREMSKLYALAAQALIPSENRAERLREYFFAVTAMQLFSPYDPYYLSMNKRRMTSFVKSTFKTPAEKKQLQRDAESIIRDYHLRPLEVVLKTLQAEDVINDTMRQQDDEPDYLRD